MGTTGSVAFVVGLLTAVIALLGYWNTQHLQRRDRRGAMYAEAMAAMRAFEQAPYLVRRRADSTGATRAEVAVRLIDLNTRVTYHEKLLRMDSSAVGEAYGLLASTTKEQVRANRDEAWRTPIISGDEQVPESTGQYPCDNEPEWNLCVLAMRRELTMFAWMRRRVTMRACVALAGLRGSGSLPVSWTDSGSSRCLTEGGHAECGCRSLPLDGGVELGQFVVGAGQADL